MTPIASAIMTFDTVTGHRARGAVDTHRLLPELHVEQRERGQRLAPEEIEATPRAAGA